MNKWSLEVLNNLLNIVYTNVLNVSFDYLRIIDLNKVKYELKAKNTLFFLTYSSEDDVLNGFINDSFDLREKVNDIVGNNPNFTFLMDKETFNRLENKSAKVVVVDNILESIDLLYDYALKLSRAKVIAVTGSVGKTTSVGLIESVLKTKYKVLRIYSKRITPLILKANIINFLTEEVDYITLEMSIYHRNHVSILSDILKPDIAALLNVCSSHLEFFDSLEDICVCKSSIFRYAKYGYYNSADKLAKKLKLVNHDLYYQNKFIYNTNLEDFKALNIPYKVDKNKLLYNGKYLDLFFLSELSLVQASLAINIGKLLEISQEDIICAINNYVPVENRLQKKIAFNKEIVFDGDITTNERITMLANNKYEKCYLVIRKFGSSENNKRFELILNSLAKFTKVFVFDDIEYLSMLKSHKNVLVVNNHDFMQKLDGVVIYHYSGYFRVYKEFKEENLITIDNEIYKIMKMG